MGHSNLVTLIIGAFVTMMVVIAIAVAVVFLVHFLQTKKVRSYRVNLEQLNTKAAKEVLVQGKTPAEALQAAQQAGRIPPGFQVVSLQEVGKKGQKLIHDAATAAVITGINSVANQNMPHLW